MRPDRHKPRFIEKAARCLFAIRREQIARLEARISGRRDIAQNARKIAFVALAKNNQLNSNYRTKHCCFLVVRL